jgi:hypothetical protein
MNIAAIRLRWLAGSLIVAATVLTAGCGVSAAPTPTTAGSRGPATSAPTGSTPSPSPSSAPTPTSTPTQSVAAAAGPDECATASLRVSIGRSGAAAGTTYLSLDLTNVSAAACFVQGYPGASLVTVGNSSGEQIGAAARRDPVTPSVRIVLAPGSVAHSFLGVGTAADYASATCDPVTAHWLKVFPPDQLAAAYVQFTAATCASRSVTLLSIQRLATGA